MGYGRGNTLIEKLIPLTSQKEIDSLGFQKNGMATIPVNPPIRVKMGNNFGQVTVYEQYPGWMRIGILFKGDNNPLFFFPEFFEHIEPIKESIQ